MLTKTLSGSAPNLSGVLLDPGFHAKTTLVHKQLVLAENNPGSLHLASSSKLTWVKHDCSPAALLHSVEMHAKRGLLNLIASRDFSTGALSQEDKREVGRAVTSTVMALNQILARKDAESPSITVHENHLIGDGLIHEDRNLPRQSNPDDYDRYHTLGVPFAENGRMQAHYHLEFRGGLTAAAVADVLNSLNDVGTVIAGREIISVEDIELILGKMPASDAAKSSLRTEIKTVRQLIPSELDAGSSKTQVRDVLFGAFTALGSANVEVSTGQVFRNAHMNGFRVAEPDCLGNGNTRLSDDLALIESFSGGVSVSSLTIQHLLDIHLSFRKAMADLPDADAVGVKELQAFKERLEAASDQVARMLRRS
ncbi:hypothetical protein [Pseudomonas sp. ACN5]|uniref:hypothetical protein n=1 Tax=Pseudomonas sp. ACN5 TaxID=1920427 RepID=UPI00114511A1|nr:hypothetical protein [Pseudomonas sp. ACN5]PBJ09502.1 hypothetical protein BSF40_07590 [Pseudomonas sp. ACN5]